VVRRGIALLTAVLGAVVLCGGGSADAPLFSSTVFFRITYHPDCTFSVAIDGGVTMDSATGTGATIPPGPYSVSVRTPLPDDTWNPSFCTTAKFSLTGPGVSYTAILGNDLGPYSATFNPSFAPASTYTIVDGNRPSQPVVFTTTATGTSTSLLPPPPASTATGTGSVQAPLMGSGIVPYRGALSATVASSNSATVTVSGKPLASLKAGRYDFVVKDESAHAGLFVQKVTRKPTALTGVAFEGKRTIRVNLTAGKWAFFAKSGRETQFVVTS
jgi:hypothetical protein